MPPGTGGDDMRMNADLFGGGDAVVKYVLEGHDRGVNWASFHPSMPLVASVADDRVVKLWRMNDTKAWEVDTLRGHFNNVSCVVFHNTKDLIISNSEDRTIRVWDASSRTPIHTFRRENDRFWTVVQPPTKNLLAVGHDTGMVVFKLDRERAIGSPLGATLYYVKDQYISALDMENPNVEARTMASCRRPTNAMVSGVRSLEVNPFNTAESNLLVMYDGDAAGYDIFAGNPSHEGSYLLSARQGSGTSVCFTARNRFAVLLKENHIGIYNLQNELSKTFDSPTPCTAIHMGGNNRVMLRDDTKASLYDLTSRKIVAEVSIPSGTRYVVWSPNMGYVAFLAKNSILCCTKNLEVLYTLHEHGRIKSACWEENNVLIYATHSHLKYCVPQAGDTAVLSSLASPVYLFRAAKGHVHYLDRSNAHHREKLATTEYLFKLALHQQRLDDVKTLLKSARLCGHVVIGYLKKRGHPEVALHFVEDPATRFNLALEYGHIQEAMPAAQSLDDKTTWARLGREALRQGNQQVVEQVYQKTKNLEGLSFLYLLTGNTGKLGKMLKIAERRNDVMSRYHNALLVGDVAERVKVLAEMGQVALAALTARTHGLEELAVTLEESLTRPVEQVRPDAALLLPPTPLAVKSGVGGKSS